MARQEGIMRFSGTLGDLIFYGDGLTRKKSEKVHRLSEASKKSSRDFGQASRYAAYIRKAFAPMVKDFGKKNLVNRLNSRLLAIYKTIPQTEIGNKRLTDGDLNLLQGFEFNAYTRLDNLLLKEISISIAPDGQLKINLPESSTEKLFKIMPKAKKVTLQMMVFNFDLIGKNYELFQVNDLKFDLATACFPGAKITLPTDQKGEKTLLIAVGIFNSWSNLRSQDRTYFACSITHVLHLKDGMPIEFIKPIVEDKPEKEESSEWSWEIG